MQIVQDFDSREIPADPNQATPPMIPTVEVAHD
jgi:hypothetical protein